MFIALVVDLELETPEVSIGAYGAFDLALAALKSHLRELFVSDALVAGAPTTFDGFEVSVLPGGDVHVRLNDGDHYGYTGFVRRNPNC